MHGSRRGLRPACGLKLPVSVAFFFECRFVMDLVQANGLVGASVLGTVENASFQGPDAASEAPHSAPPSPGFTTQFTCFTGTKV
jgi:hypothetical protein